MLGKNSLTAKLLDFLWN